MIPAPGWTATLYSEFDDDDGTKRKMYHKHPLIGFGDNGEPYIWTQKRGMCDAREVSNFERVNEPSVDEDVIRAMIPARHGVFTRHKWVNKETGKTERWECEVVCWAIVNGEIVPMVWREDYNCLTNPFDLEDLLDDENVKLVMPEEQSNG